jgi:hypothetical protein
MDWRRGLTAAVVAWLFLAPAISQEKSEKFSLTFAPLSGSRLAYNLSSSMNTSGKDFLGKDISLGALVTGPIFLSVGAVTADRVRTRLSTPGIQVDVRELNGTRRMMVGTKADRSVEAIFTPTGKLEALDNGDALTRQYILNLSVWQILRDCFPIFPPGKVAVGESWVDNRTMHVPFLEMDVKVIVDSKYTLNDVQTSGQGLMAMISVDFTVRIAGTKLMGESIGIVEGNGSGTGHLQFLMDRGYFSDYRLVHQTRASLVIKRGEAKLLEYPFDLTFSASLTLTQAY